MKLLAKVWVTGLLLILFTVNAWGLDLEKEQGDALGISNVESALPEGARALMGDVSAADINSSDTVLSRMGAAIGELLTGAAKKGLRSSAVIMIIVLLCSMLRSTGIGGSQDFVHLGAVLSVGAVAAGDMGSFIGLGGDVLYQLSSFSKLLLPSLSAAAAASGAVTSASVKYAATALFMDILLTVSQNVVMPLVYAYIAATIANAALGGAALSGAAELLKWLCKTLIIMLVLAFTAYLGLTGIISGSADAVATRVTKTAISSLLPVVGSIISDAAGVVVSGAAMLRNAVGIFGMLAVVCTCIAPFITLGTHYLLYKAVAGVSETVTDKRISGLISGIGTAFGLVLSLVGAGAIMLFISIISCMKAVLLL